MLAREAGHQAVDAFECAGVRRCERCARGDPTGFVRGLDSAIIDEIQRAPQLLLPLKRSVDADRRPGRFLLTGSVNLHALPALSDSLAGRIETIDLLPLAQC